MPGPQPFPCGKPGQPSCPPVDTLLAFQSLTPEQIKAAHEHIQATDPLPKEHWWHRFFEDFNNAAGEAKFGR
jgi:hypothetical protein